MGSPVTAAWSFDNELSRESLCQLISLVILPKIGETQFIIIFILFMSFKGLYISNISSCAFPFWAGVFCLYHYLVLVVLKPGDLCQVSTISGRGRRRVGLPAIFTDAGALGYLAVPGGATSASFLPQEPRLMTNPFLVVLWSPCSPPRNRYCLRVNMLFLVNVLRPLIAIGVYTSLARCIMYHTDLTGLSPELVPPVLLYPTSFKSQKLSRQSISKRGSKAVYLKKNVDESKSAGDASPNVMFPIVDGNTRSRSTV